jgi:hypothetical protein
MIQQIQLHLDIVTASPPNASPAATKETRRENEVPSYSMESISSGLSARLNQTRFAIKSGATGLGPRSADALTEASDPRRRWAMASRRDPFVVWLDVRHRLAGFRVAMPKSCHRLIV